MFIKGFLRMGHDWFPPYPSQFTNYNLPYIDTMFFCSWTGILKQPKKQNNSIITIIIVIIFILQILLLKQHDGSISMHWFNSPLFSGGVPHPQPKLSVTLWPRLTSNAHKWWALWLYHCWRGCCRLCAGQQVSPILTISNWFKMCTPLFTHGFFVIMHIFLASMFICCAYSRHVAKLITLWRVKIIFPQSL